ncbi:hypothetical protein C8F01DRAFT_1137680 [Mycena amicta]|nr:hypothetical protein C8F01DRAFT_1137680 [Mycena amicta]
MYAIEKSRDLKQTRPRSTRLLLLVVFLLLATAGGWNEIGYDARTIRRSTALFFDVPLDYDAPTDPDKVVIALRMFPATVPFSERIGSIFTDPGGPGASGHGGLLRTGPLLSDIFEGKFDIISWDPRGVNMTTPRISCHPTDLYRALFSLNNDNPEISFEPEDRALLKRSLLVGDARTKLLTSLCRESLGDKVLRSVTTVNVVRDMEEMRKAVGEGGMRYWGFSYGTLLGATYVAMFPEQAERFILDGVIYAPEPYSSMLNDAIGTGTSINGEFDGFISYCAAAGPERCGLATNTSSPSDLSTRISALASRLEHTPLPVSLPNPTVGGIPTLLHRTHLIRAIFTSFYRPNSWSALAEAIAATETGDGTLLAGLSGAGGRDWPDLRRNITDSERAAEGGWNGREMGPSEAAIAVMCGDAPPFVVAADDDDGWTGEWLGWRDQLMEPNPLGGASLFTVMVACRHWGQVQPTPERYEGPWEMGVDLRKPKNPVVFLSNSFDPVTPIANSIRMVELLGVDNARLLHNNGYGHCSTNHPSLCIAKTLKAYMIEGTLFENGTVCEPEEGIIFPPVEKTEVASVEDGHGYSDDDRELASTLRALADAGIGMPVSGHGHGWL